MRVMVVSAPALHVSISLSAASNPLEGDNHREIYTCHGADDCTQAFWRGSEPSIWIQQMKCTNAFEEFCVDVYLAIRYLI